MFKPVQFPEPVESLVKFVEETDPSEIIEATLEKLRGGTPVIDLLRAAGLAVVRSTDLPANHHGGPVHPVSGIFGTYNIYRRLEGESAYIPVVQHVTLCNNHVHSAQMGPYIMPEMEPLQSHGEKIGSYHMGDSLELGFRSTARDGDATALTEEAFHKSLESRSPSVAQQYYLWLLENVSHGQAMDILLPSSISRNAMDDHYFVYPVFTFRTLDLVGWEWAPYFLRPVVRFLARHPYSIDVERPMPFSAMEEMVDKYGLDDRKLPVSTSSRETEMIGSLAEQIGRSNDYYDTPDMIAQALADGLSLEGGGRSVGHRRFQGIPQDHLWQPHGCPHPHWLHQPAVFAGPGRREPAEQGAGADVRHNRPGVCPWDEAGGRGGRKCLGPHARRQPGRAATSCEREHRVPPTLRLVQSQLQQHDRSQGDHPHHRPRPPVRREAV